MNYVRILLAALGGTVAYFAVGFLTFAGLPAMVNEFRKYSTIYRTQEDIKSVMPFGMIGIFVAVLVITVIYSMAYRGGSGLVEGARFGALVGVFVVCGFVLHNYVNLNIGLKLTVLQGVAYFAEWVIVGIVIGLVYRPPAQP